jgi:hypothetical protein
MEEIMRRYLLCALGLSFFIALKTVECAYAAPAPSRVIAILVGNTKNAELGKSALTNINNMRMLLNYDIHGAGKIDIDEFNVMGAGFSCAAIERILAGKPDVSGKKLDVSPSDTVIFYYAGHGYRVEPAQASDKFPLLECSSIRTLSAPELQPDKDLRFSWIMDKLFAMKPRLVIGIADACNVEVYAKGGAISRGVDYLPGEGARRLFLEYKGMLSFSGSVPRGESYYYPPEQPDGGLFTNQLLNSILDELVRAKSSDTQPSWEAIEAAATKPIKPTLDLPLPATQQPQFDDYRDDPVRKLRIVGNAN